MDGLETIIIAGHHLFYILKKYKKSVATKTQ